MEVEGIEPLKEGKDIIKKLRKQKKIAFETMRESDDNTRESLKLLRLAGTTLEEMQEEYLGSAVVHFYEVMGDEKSLILKVQAPLQEVNEVQAYIGLSELKRKMMQTYGRKV